MTLRQLSAASRGEEAQTILPQLVNKLYGTECGDAMVGLAFDLLGDDGLRAPFQSSWTAGANTGITTDWVDAYLFELASAIAAGSSNIQRNVIGERGLGLPRDLRRG